jgi:hypothetical protein
MFSFIDNKCSLETIGKKHNCTFVFQHSAYIEWKFLRKKNLSKKALLQFCYTEICVQKELAPQICNLAFRICDIAYVAKKQD